MTAEEQAATIRALLDEFAGMVAEVRSTHPADGDEFVAAATAAGFWGGYYMEAHPLGRLELVYLCPDDDPAGGWLVCYLQGDDDEELVVEEERVVFGC